MLAGKKVSGIKCHIAVDTQGLPHAVAVTTADVVGRKGAPQARSEPGVRPAGRQRLRRSVLRAGVQEILGGRVTVQIAKMGELYNFKVMPKRWIVERSFAWLGKSRRL